ncbi:TetR/AcrR family transcriptional regulator [Sphingomonas crocodyli]|uniref:TetR/AcrR family transcriptional regulator n=2 Tax=Sphingomonas crocodyli TaxID=1979270 RepID=A0A437LUT3_9SPHN|nr:TetR/AcrR family transcriptional regulator [Sphingomonas crocodyli]
MKCNHVISFPSGLAPPADFANDKAMTSNVAFARPANRAGRPTKADLERRKARIVEVAEAMFIEQGFAATTLEGIAREAGVATRTLYHHYGDKAALFRVIVQERTRMGSPTEIYALDAIGKRHDPRDVLRAATRRLLSICLSPETIAIEQMMVADMKRFPDLPQSVVAPNVAQLQDSLADLLRSMESHHLIGAIDHDAAAKYFIDLMVGMASFHLLVGYAEGVPDDAEIDRKIDLFLAGLDALKRA